MVNLQVQQKTNSTSMYLVGGGGGIDGVTSGLAADSRN